ncbi:MAG: hypothetical protein Q8O88_05935 [bacterium]|nr:hypothetical protein [bacterium]
MKEVGSFGYCGSHGGVERLEKEWAVRLAREQAQLDRQKTVLNGQAAPVNGGLSRFGAKKKVKLSRAQREVARDARRAERLSAQPKRGSTGKIEDKGKGGKKKKSGRSR